MQEDPVRGENSIWKNHLHYPLEKHFCALSRFESRERFKILLSTKSRRVSLSKFNSFKPSPLKRTTVGTFFLPKERTTQSPVPENAELKSESTN